MRLLVLAFTICLIVNAIVLLLAFLFCSADAKSGRVRGAELGSPAAWFSYVGIIPAYLSLAMLYPTVINSSTMKFDL